MVFFMPIFLVMNFSTFLLTYCEGSSVFVAIDANNNFETTSVAPKMHNLTDELVNVVNTTEATSINETSSNEYYSTTPKINFSTTTSKVQKIDISSYLELEGFN